MSRHFKAIIPLLGEGITLDDIDPKKGFIGAYSYDLNRPTLDTHFFLLYIYNVTNFFMDRDKRLKALSTFQSRKIIHIKGFLIACYTFNTNVERINTIVDDHWVLKDEDKLKIFKFWNFTDDDINQYMLNRFDFEYGKQFEQVVIPLWDCPKEYQWRYELTVPKK